MTGGLLTCGQQLLAGCSVYPESMTWKGTADRSCSSQDHVYHRHNPIGEREWGCT